MDKRYKSVRILWAISLLIALIGPVKNAVGSTPKRSVCDILKTLSFRPAFPKDKELVKLYGKSVVDYGTGEAVRVYRLRDGLWLGCRIEQEEKVNRPITGLLISRKPLTSKANITRLPFTCDGLAGLDLGDDAEKAVRLLGEPLRKYSRRFGPESTAIVYEFFPRTLAPGSCLRVYLQNDKIEALSFSSEE